jgi:high frequency lysogenization protein
MRDSLEAQVVSLAALLLYCQCVDQLARTGALPPDRLRAALATLLEPSPERGLALYRAADHLYPGLELLEPLLRAERNTLSPQVMRYLIGVLYLQRRLQRDPATRARIYAGLERASTQAELYSPTHDNVIASLAQCYQDTFGAYRFRIQVRGESGYLRQPAVAARVRCLLFSAIRAAVLWHQAGGRRWHLMLRRQPLLREAHRLRRQL